MPYKNCQTIDGSKKKRPVVRLGFTLVELVVVILILGILAGVAAPRLFKVTEMAAESNLKQNLAVIRDAIEFYKTENAGALPGADGTEATFKNDLALFIRDRFPENSIKEQDAVDVKTSGAPLAYGGGPYGWLYDNQSGEFIANSNSTSSDGVTKYWEY